jgi:hypothetical protein
VSNTTINQAKQILDTHTSGELAARLGIKSTNFSGLKSGKRPLTEKMATRIVEAFVGKVEKAATVEPEKPSPKKAAAKRQAHDHPPKGSSAFNPPKQVKPQEDLAALAEQAYSLLSKMGMDGAARCAITKVIEDEVGPALAEKIGQALGGLAPAAASGSSHPLPAFLVIPLYVGGGKDEKV